MRTLEKDLITIAFISTALVIMTMASGFALGWYYGTSDNICTFYDS